MTATVASLRPITAELRHRENDRKLWTAVVAAAQASYAATPEYGLSDADMEAAVRAALGE